MILTLQKVKESSVAYTHAGKFHADDVFSSALLRIINPSIKIIRTFKPPYDNDAIVFDIGMGRYDHHQYNSEVRENGVPYASFGLLWKDLGESIIGAKQAAMIDEQFVQEIDLTDNVGQGEHKNLLSHSISVFNSTWKEQDCMFEDAVKLATMIFKRKLKYSRDKIDSDRMIREIYNKQQSNKNLLILKDKFIPWMDVASSIPEIKFCIFPSQRDGYNIQVIPKSKEDNTYRVNLPQTWYGMPEESLPVGVLFCHHSGFLATCDTLQRAISICEKCIADNNTY